MPHLKYLLLACLGLAAAAPRGTVKERQHGVQCRTEYITVWDTEYEERETQECVTKWVPECTVVSERKCEPTTRNVVSSDDFFVNRSSLSSFLLFSVTRFMKRNVQLCGRMCVRRRTKLSM